MAIRVVIFDALKELSSNNVIEVIEKESLSHKDYEVINNYIMQSKDYIVEIYHV